MLHKLFSSLFSCPLSHSFYMLMHLIGFFFAEKTPSSYKFAYVPFFSETSIYKLRKAFSFFLAACELLVSILCYSYSLYYHINICLCLNIYKFFYFIKAFNLIVAFYLISNRHATSPLPGNHVVFYIVHCHDCAEIFFKPKMPQNS